MRQLSAPYPGSGSLRVPYSSSSFAQLDFGVGVGLRVAGERDAPGCKAKWKGSRRGRARGLHQIPGLPLQALGEGSDLWGLGPAAPRQPRRGATSHVGEGVCECFQRLWVLTVLEVAGAISGPVPAPRPGPFVCVVVVVIGVVVRVLIRIVRVVAHHAVHAAGRPEVTECRALRRLRPVISAGGTSVAGPRQVAGLEPVAGGGPGATGGGSRRPSVPRPSRRCAVVAEQKDRRARLRGSGVGGARGGDARVPSALRLVLRAQAQKAEHLPVVLPLDSLAPGARSRRQLPRGLLLAGGRWGAVQDRAELQWPEQERGPGEAHRSLCRIVPTPGGRSSGKRKTGFKSREAERSLQPGRRAERGYLSPHQAVPRVGCRPFSSKDRCWDVALASRLFPSPGRRRRAARRPQRAAVSGAKEGEILNFLARLQSYTSRSGPAAPPLFVHVMRLETCKGDSSSPLPLPPCPVLLLPPDTLHRER